MAVSASEVVKTTSCGPDSDTHSNEAGTARFPFPASPALTIVVTPPARWYTSWEESVSLETSDSLVSKNTVPSPRVAPAKVTLTSPLPPSGPMEASVTALSDQS